jgi:hypothetical protein
MEINKHNQTKIEVVTNLGPDRTKSFGFGLVRLLIGSTGATL